jgi:uncharacterized protein (TIGR03118 family)
MGSRFHRNQILGQLALGAALIVSPAFAHGADRDCYHQRNLVSDDATIMAEHHDANLINPWGIAFNPTGVVWVSDNGTGKSTLYDGNGNAQTLVVSIPSTSGAGSGKPTGIVFSASADFVVTKGALSGSSRFLFASEDGGISGWAPNVDMTNAILAVNNAATGAIYKGLALAGDGTRFLLFATDFHNGRIDVFDGTFKHVNLGPGAFVDPRIPMGFAPFGIQAINGDLYVTYAKQDADREDDVAGPGFGFVDVFDTGGHLLRRFASRGRLNAPWGLALAPSGFGEFSNHLLVGNFGDGAINAYDLATGEWDGKLRAQDGHVLRIEGLWGLSFGNGVQNQPTNTLFFTAGPDDESHGLYGRLSSAACRDDDDHHRRDDAE